MHWLPNPPDGTPIALGFDGSDVDDHTAIRAETMDGFMFTPRIECLDGSPSIWNPAEHDDHRIPRWQVHDALAEIFERFTVTRFYYDPPLWSTEGETWALEYGEKRVIPWETYRNKPMHGALERFVTDLRTGALKHDGCPISTLHVAATVKVARRGMETYGVAKASRLQKIDAAVTSVLAHEAKSDAAADGWKPTRPARARQMIVIN